MKTLLITGFEPFGGEAINPSWEAVKRLPNEIGEYRLCKCLVPVVFGEGAACVMQVAEEIAPDVILCIGQAGGRNAITPELVGINLRHSESPDNAGYRPTDETIVRGGENALFSTLPVRRMAEAVTEVGIPSRVSYTAGAYVCNDLLYTLLNRYKNTQARVGFIHIPYCTEQQKEPSMELDAIVQGLTAAIEAMEGDAI